MLEDNRIFFKTYFLSLLRFTVNSFFSNDSYWVLSHSAYVIIVLDWLVQLLFISYSGIDHFAGASLKIIQLLQHFEHLVIPLAQAVELISTEYGVKTMVAEIMRLIVQQIAVTALDKNKKIKHLHSSVKGSTFKKHNISFLFCFETDIDVQTEQHHMEKSKVLPPYQC